MDDDAASDIDMLVTPNERGAEAIVVACPMCHVNLDMKQADIERRYAVRHAMPVYYLSDLVGVALGIGQKTLGIDRHFVAAGLKQSGE